MKAFSIITYKAPSLIVTQSQLWKLIHLFRVIIAKLNLNLVFQSKQRSTEEQLTILLKPSIKDKNIFGIRYHSKKKQCINLVQTISWSMQNLQKFLKITGGFLKSLINFFD